MTTPRVSVCVVTYNHERYIHDCIMTVLAQAHDFPLEILIGDDQSTDRTEEIARALAEQFPDAIRYFRHENRLRPGGNYQFLIGQAKGEYIAHLDGDDYWLPGKLSAQLGILDTSPECVAVYTNAICVNDEGVVLGFFNNPVQSRFDLNSLLRRGNFLNHSSLVYRVEFARYIREWLPDFIDYRIHILLAQHGQLAYLQAPYVGYRVNSVGSMLVNQNDHVRELYWSAVHEALSLTGDEDTKMLAVASFLTGVFVRARETGSMNFFIRWWRVVTSEFRCNRVHLALQVIMVMIRRWFLSLLSKYTGRVVGVPSRIFHRR